MYISKAKKYRDQGDGTAIAYDYYRLTKSYIDKDGKTKHRSVLCLGYIHFGGKGTHNFSTGKTGGCSILGIFPNIRCKLGFFIQNQLGNWQKTAKI